MHALRTARLGIDIGGTFTDLVLADSDGAVWSHKISTSADDYTRAIVQGTARPLADAGLAPGDVREVAVQADTPDVIAFDMGGTTAKASAIEGGRIMRTTEYQDTHPALAEVDRDALGHAFRALEDQAWAAMHAEGYEPHVRGPSASPICATSGSRRRSPSRWTWVLQPVQLEIRRTRVTSWPQQCRPTRRTISRGRRPVRPRPLARRLAGGG